MAVAVEEEGPQITTTGREIIFTAPCQIRILKETASMDHPPIYMEGPPPVTFFPGIGRVNMICPLLPYLEASQQQLNTVRSNPLFMNRDRNVLKSTSQPLNPLPTYIFNLIMVPGIIIWTLIEV